MKKLTAIFLSVIMVIFLCFNVSCADPQKLTDVKEYRALTANVDKIEAYYDTGSFEFFKFDIVDKKEIQELMNSLLSSPLENLGSGNRAGGNTYVKLFQGEKEYEVRTPFKIGKNFYSFEDTIFWKRISDKARELGAHDITLGVVLKISDAPESSTEEIFFDNKTELTAHVDENFSDGKYLYNAIAEERDALDIFTNTTETKKLTYETTIQVPYGKYLTIYYIYRTYKIEDKTFSIKPSESITVSTQSEMNFEDLGWTHISLKVSVIPA